MVTTRILDRRRLANPSPERTRRRRPSLAPAAVSARLRLDTFGILYLVSALILAALLVYLLQVAQVTKSSYELGQLRAEQAQLLSEQQQLRYQEANLTAPARVQQEAAKSGMQQVQPSQYVAYQPVQTNILAPVGQPASDQTPLWQRAVAAVFGSLGS